MSQFQEQQTWNERGYTWFLKFQSLRRLKFLCLFWQTDYVSKEWIGKTLRIFAVEALGGWNCMINWNPGLFLLQCFADVSFWARSLQRLLMVSYWGNNLQLRDRIEQLCVGASLVTSPSQKLLWNGEKNPPFLWRYSETERVGWWDLVKVYVRVGLYIHMLQQDLCDLFHTAKILPETEILPCLSGHTLQYVGFDSRASFGVFALGFSSSPALQLTIFFGCADVTWAECVFKVKQWIHVLQRLDWMSLGTSDKGLLGAPW